jgi:hypothetical protein
VLAVVAVGAAVQDRLEDPETGLAPEVEVADDGGAVLELQVGHVFVVTAVAAAAAGQGPGDFKAVAVAVTMISGDGEVGRQIDLDGNSSHDLLLRECFRAKNRSCRTSAPFW